jgi:DNA-binding XRE family transcriptional regulator
MPARRDRSEWDVDKITRACQIGRDVRAERTKRGWTQEDFEPFGVSRNTISKIENGDLRGRSPRVLGIVETAFKWPENSISDRLAGRIGPATSEAQVVAAVEQTVVRMLGPFLEALTNAVEAFRDTSALRIYIDGYPDDEPPSGR